LACASRTAVAVSSPEADQHQRHDRGQPAGHPHRADVQPSDRVDRLGGQREQDDRDRQRNQDESRLHQQEQHQREGDDPEQHVGQLPRLAPALGGQGRGRLQLVVDHCGAVLRDSVKPGTAMPDPRA